MADIRKPQIILYRGFPGSGHYTSSPFVTKIEARLRFAGLRYQTEAGSIRNAPRGKVPYLTITDPDTAISRTLCDSDLIIKDLVETGLVSALNTDLNASHRTYDLALRGLLENRLYFLMVCILYLTTPLIQRDNRIDQSQVARKVDRKLL
jgi:hypothetical protein